MTRTVNVLRPVPAPASLPPVTSHLTDAEVVVMEIMCETLRDEKLAPEKQAIPRESLQARFWLRWAK